MPLLARLKQLPYRVMRRIAIANRTLFFGCDLASLSHFPCPEGLTVVQWTEDDLRQHLGEENYLDEGHAVWLRDDQAVCFAVMDGERLAGFAWIAHGDVPGEMNHDGHPDTQLPLFLPDDTGFVFHVFILPSYRGRRLYAALMSSAAHQLPNRGIEKLVLTTECTNRSATSQRRSDGLSPSRSCVVDQGRTALQCRLSGAAFPRRSPHRHIRRRSPRKT